MKISQVSFEFYLLLKVIISSVKYGCVFLPYKVTVYVVPYLQDFCDDVRMIYSDTISLL